MSERTQRDETVDKAIELLIADETDGFTMTAVQGDEVHVVKETDMDESLLSVFAIVEEIRRMTAAAGEYPGSMTPQDVFIEAGQIAAERGLIAGGMERDAAPVKAPKK